MKTLGPLENGIDIVDRWTSPLKVLVIRWMLYFTFGVRFRPFFLTLKVFWTRKGLIKDYVASMDGVNPSPTFEIGSLYSAHKKWRLD